MVIFFKLTKIIVYIIEINMINFLLCPWILYTVYKFNINANFRNPKLPSQEEFEKSLNSQKEKDSESERL